MSHGHDDIQKHVKIYKAVFFALMILTVLTVAVSYLHLPLVGAILVALLIAAFKGSLVAGFFMHLYQEKPVILWVLLLTSFFFLILLLIPVFSRG